MSPLEVRPHHGTPTLFVDGQPKFPAIFLANIDLADPANSAGVEERLADFRDTGFEFYSCSIEGAISFDVAYDPATGEFPEERFAKLENLRQYVEIVPGGKFLLRVGTEPRFDTSAWVQQHPDECEVLEPSAKGIYATPSYASKLWIRDASKYLRALIAYIYKHGLDPYIMGYLVCAGNSAEWVKIGPMEDWAGDYSRPMQDAFREWLRVKYRTVAALREAWADPNVDFDQDLVPSPQEQGDADLFLFKDPHRRRRAIDHFQCHAHVLAEDIKALCGVVKEACKREHLAGVFYGYLQELVWNDGFFGQGLYDADVAHSAAARSGHAGLKEVLASPDVDFFSSPYSYGFRGTGGEGGFMSLQASVRRAGKLWFSEEDMRTHYSPEFIGYGQTRNPRETSEVLKRQFANVILHSEGGWWCDFASRAEPEVLQTLRRSLDLGKHQLALPDRTSAAEVAVVIDAESAFYRSTLNNFDIPNWRNRAWGIARMGTAVDWLLLSDILDGRARDYKLYYFMNAFHFSAAEREKMKNMLRRNGKVALWMYAPGFVDEETMDVAHCNDLTGLTLHMTDRQWGANIYVSNFNHPITRGLPTSTFWGTDTRLGPLFVARDPESTTLGTVVINQGRCEPGFVLKEHRAPAGKLEWASLYSAAPMVPPGVLREVARYAGAHIYTENEDVFYADRNHVMLHTVRGEVKTIHLPYRADVWDWYSGCQIAQNVTTFQDYMEEGTTKVYLYQ